MRTACRCQLPGTPLSECSPALSNSKLEPITAPRTVSVTMICPPEARSQTRLPMLTARPEMSPARNSTSPVCIPPRTAKPASCRGSRSRWRSESHGWRRRR